MRIAVNDRVAIYAEEFPGALSELAPGVGEWFTHDEAHEVLYTFAGAWPVLGRDTGEPSTRYVYRVLGGSVCEFRGVELAPGTIVVDDVLSD